MSVVPFGTTTLESSIFSPLSSSRVVAYTSSLCLFRNTVEGDGYHFVSYLDTISGSYHAFGSEQNKLELQHSALPEMISTTYHFQNKDTLVNIKGKVALEPYGQDLQMFLFFQEVDELPW